MGCNYTGNGVSVTDEDNDEGDVRMLHLVHSHWINLYFLLFAYTKTNWWWHEDDIFSSWSQDLHFFPSDSLLRGNEISQSWLNATRKIEDDNWGTRSIWRSRSHINIYEETTAVGPGCVLKQTDNESNGNERRLLFSSRSLDQIFSHYTCLPTRESR